MLMQNRAELQVCLEQAELIYVPTIVLGELHVGFCLGSRFEQNRQQLEAFLDLPGVQITVLDEAVAQRYDTSCVICDSRALRSRPMTCGSPRPPWKTGARLVSYDAHFECVPGLIVIAP